jgi:predicted dehydrogenase
MKRALLIGAGGFGGAWVRHFLPQVRDRIDPVGVVDIDEQTRQAAAAALGTPAFASLEEALDSTVPELAFVVIPPTVRPPVIRALARHGIDVLCEKPIAASWAQTLEIGAIAREAGIRLAVMQNYREQSRIRALKSVLARPDLRDVHLIECRFAIDHTIDTAGGAFRWQIPDAFIYEGSEHHLDQLRNLLDDDAAWVQAHQWGPPWSTFPGPTTVLATMQFRRGAMVQYTMNHVERGIEHGWHKEFYRIATRGGTVTLDRDDVIRIARGSAIEEVPVAIDPADGHIAVIRRFVDWTEGGEAPVSAFADNVRTMALTFALVEASHTGRRVDVPAMLAAAGFGE